MNHDQAIEALQAHKEGKTVQGKPKDSNHPWIDLEIPHFNFLVTDFRAKPEPRTIFLNSYEDGSEFIYTTKQAAVIQASPHNGIREIAVEFREVFE